MKRIKQGENIGVAMQVQGAIVKYIRIKNLKECINLYIEMKNGLVVVMLLIRNMNHEMD